MGGKRISKRCLICKKFLQGKSTKIKYCTKCGTIFRHDKRRKELKENKRCIDCGKPINPMIIQEDGPKSPKKIKYPIRCYKCRLKNREKSKEWRTLKSKKELNTNE